MPNILLIRCTFLKLFYKSPFRDTDADSDDSDEDPKSTSGDKDDPDRTLYLRACRVVLKDCAKSTLLGTPARETEPHDRSQTDQPR